MGGAIAGKWSGGFPRIVLARHPVCPLCTGTTFRRAEAGGLDGVLKLLGLLPVRCVNCWRRYYTPGGVAVGE